MWQSSCILEQQYHIKVNSKQLQEQIKFIECLDCKETEQGDVDWINLADYGHVEGSYKHSNELLGSI
jgi:hypothetical protein